MVTDLTTSSSSRDSVCTLCHPGDAPANHQKNVGNQIPYSLHLWSHSPIWATLVFFPSLVFGYLRDQFDSTVPSIVMHIWYNGGYFFFIDSSQLPIQSGLQ